MERTIAKKIAIITGASKGIGKSIALLLAKKKCRLALIGRNHSNLLDVQKKCQQLGSQAEIFPYDLSEVDNIEEMINKINHKFNGIDILINNAGIAPESIGADKADLKEWDQVLQINLRSLIHLTRHTLPWIKNNNWGAIINIASICGKMSFANNGIYCATKHAIVGYTGSLYEDVREYNIKVCAICPRFVNTGMMASSGAIPEKMVQPEDVARAVLFVLKFPDSACPTEIIIRPQKSPSNARFT